MSVKKKKKNLDEPPLDRHFTLRSFAEERERKKKTHTRKKIYTHI